MFILRRGNPTVSAEYERMAQYNGLSDEHLIDAIKARDEQALATLYERHSPLIYRLVMHVLNNHSLAQEVTQDVFLSIWKSPERWDAEKGQFAHWMMRVARHIAIDRLRHEQRRSPRSVVSWESVAHMLPSANPGRHDATDQYRALRVLMRQIPKDQLDVIKLAYFKGMSYEEIAETLAIPHSTAKSRLRLGMQKLRTLWLDTFHEQPPRLGALREMASNDDEDSLG